VAVLIFITFLMVYFVIKYSRKRHPRGEDIEGNTTLEIVWTITPLVLFLAMFYFGWTNFNYMRNVPAMPWSSPSLPGSGPGRSPIRTASIPSSCIWHLAAGENGTRVS